MSLRIKKLSVRHPATPPPRTTLAVVVGGAVQIPTKTNCRAGVKRINILLLPCVLIVYKRRRWAEATVQARAKAYGIIIGALA